MTPDAADLTLQRWGLRFAAPAEEAGYRRWRVVQVRPVMRTGVFTALAAWGIALVAFYLAAPQVFATAARWILGLMIPLVMAHLAMTYVHRLSPLLTPITVVSTAVSGFLTLILVLELIHSPVIAMGAATITVFIGFTIFRLSPLPGVLCNAPYVLWGCAQTFAAFHAGQIGLPEFVGSVTILLTAFMMGLAVCTELERMSRASYRDQRVIEQQRQALMEERANLSRFLSPEVSQMVRERGIEATLVQQTLPLTLVSCDLRGFTAYTKHNGAAQMTAVLHDYYAIVVEVSRRYGGTVSGFAGDGALILLGAPIPRTDHAHAGIGLGRDLLGAVGALTARFGTPATPLGVGVGIATGICAVGAIGSQQRLEYTAIGSAVNLASRLCGQAAHGQMLMCPATTALVERLPGWREEQVQVKGFDLPVTVTLEATLPAAPDSRQACST